MPGLPTPPPQLHPPKPLASPKPGNASPRQRSSSFRIPSPSPPPSPSPSPSASRSWWSSPDRQTRTSRKLRAAKEAPSESLDLAPFLLKLARDTMASGDSLKKALDYAIRASASFERACADRGDPRLELDLAGSLHMVAAIHRGMGRFEEAVRVLERAVRVPDVGKGPDHALCACSGYMQLGDAHSALGQLDRSISSYELGLKIHVEALGSTDPRIADSCRYLAEAYVQAMRFDDAENLCKMMLKIHRLHSTPASLQEAADRRLMALICEAKADYEVALEHLVLASMTAIANGQDTEVADIDVSIGNIYLALCRYDEAIFSYQKALTVLKSAKGDNHPSVASVFIRLADLYCRTGKLRESISYCENALRVYAKPVPGTSEETAIGLTEISAIYGVLSDPEEALRLLQRALQLMDDNSPRTRRTIAGVEAQTGIMFYMVGRYWESWSTFENAVAKLRANGESKSALFGAVLNQMGLACLQLYKINEAATLFEEARAIMEQEHGSCHLDTLGVYSNLAATYDAMGRVEDAIHILEYILKVREEELGTANPEVNDEKKRLTELLRDSGRARIRKGKSLESLLDSSSLGNKREERNRQSELKQET